MGAYALDDDGTALWSAGEGHGNRSVLADIDPARSGLELWYCQGGASNNYQEPFALRDAATGARLFHLEEQSWKDQWALAADIDPTKSGMELWGSRGSLYDSGGNEIADNPGTCDLAIYWDSDPLRELLGTDMNGYVDLYKWNYQQRTLALLQTLEGKLVGLADVFGDWREEIIMSLGDEIRIYTSVNPAERRMVTLMHDSLYRLSVSTQTMGLMQSTQSGRFIGAGMTE